MRRNITTKSKRENPVCWIRPTSTDETGQKGETPMLLIKKNPATKKQLDQNEMKVMSRKVMRDGVRISGKSYFHPDLIYLLGRHVNVIVDGITVFLINENTFVTLEEI